MSNTNVLEIKTVQIAPFRTLMTALKDTRAQVFVTATEPDLIDVSDWPDSKMFHVKHGSFQDVV